MKSWMRLAGLIGCLLCGLIHLSANAGEIEHSLGYRPWFASWEQSDVDLGDAVLHMAFYGIRQDRLGLMLIAGYGDGWESRGEFDRLDGQLALNYLFRRDDAGSGNLRASAGWHYIRISTDDHPEAFGEYLDGGGQVTFQGPEVALSYSHPIGDSGLIGHGSLSWLPLVLWELEQNTLQEENDDGTTMGLTVDVGVSYRWDPALISVGYRYSKINTDRGSYEFGDTGTYAEVGETFAGPYFQLTFQF